MNIKYFETANNTKHNISGMLAKNMTTVKGKKIHTVKGFKSLEFNTMSYPDIKITNFDFCDDKEELVKIDMNFSFEVSKKEFFDIVAGLRQMDCLWFDDCFPMKVKMETCIKNPDKFYWLYAKNIEKKLKENENPSSV